MAFQGQTLARTVVLILQTQTEYWVTKNTNIGILPVLPMEVQVIF